MNGFRSYWKKLTKIPLVLCFLVWVLPGSSQDLARNKEESAGTVSARDTISRVSFGDTINIQLRKFEPDQATKKAVDLVLEHSGMKGSIRVVEDPDIPTCIAFTENEQRFIAYNRSFINEINRKTHTPWAVISVMAHEIAHHLYGHTIGSGRLGKKEELQADSWSGFILYKMGADLEETLITLKKTGYKLDTIDHPGISKRIEAVREGWNKARGLGKRDPQQPTALQEAFPVDKEKGEVELNYKFSFVGEKTIFFIDNKDRVLHFNEEGQAVVKGFRRKRRKDGYPWLCRFKEDKYQIDPNGAIWFKTAHGSFMRVGEVVALRDEEDKKG